MNDNAEIVKLVNTQSKKINELAQRLDDVIVANNLKTTPDLENIKNTLSDFDKKSLT